jgi:hypothetical protein
MGLMNRLQQIGLDAGHTCNIGTKFTGNGFACGFGKGIGADRTIGHIYTFGQYFILYSFLQLFQKKLYQKLSRLLKKLYQKQSLLLKKKVSKTVTIFEKKQ